MSTGYPDGLLLDPAGGGAGLDRTVETSSEVIIPPGQTKSRPDKGLIEVRTTTLNQNDEAGFHHQRPGAAPLEIGEFACAPINSPS
jgi:hypothetical protein